MWRSAFATEQEEDFDLYVLVADDWVYFAVSPFLSPQAVAEPARFQRSLLRLNQELHLARFALDSQGDVNLVADVPTRLLHFPYFQQIVDLLVFYTGRLAGELQRVAADPEYHSPLFE
jgi:hypothetical protein